MKPAEKRKRLIAALHIAKAKAGLDDDTYRDVLAHHYQPRPGERPSAKNMATHQIGAALREISEKSGIPMPNQHKKPVVSAERAALIDKIEALLADKGRRQGRTVPWAYADGMAKRMCNVEKVQWCTPEQLAKLVAALSIDQKRMDRGAA